jgi:hypothetical protein
MPFLFVDYDLGAGGEYFCRCLSQAPQAETLKYSVFDTGRTKVFDVFDQEFLKTPPNINKIPIINEKYNLVPTHRHTALAKKILKNINTIRIQGPVDCRYFNFLKYQHFIKLALVTEPTQDYFLGRLKILVKTYKNTDFLSQVTRSTDNLSLLLLAQGLQPTIENRNIYINNVVNMERLDPEPDFDYDLTIPYETLFNDPKSIAISLQQKFGLEIDTYLLEKYRKDFELYQAQS